MSEYRDADHPRANIASSVVEEAADAEDFREFVLVVETETECVVIAVVRDSNEQGQRLLSSERRAGHGDEHSHDGESQESHFNNSFPSAALRSPLR